jgi:hypothetical protein
MSFVLDVLMTAFMPLVQAGETPVLAAIVLAIQMLLFIPVALSI